MNNEKGFTLIELLGALVLLGIVTMLAVTVIVQSINQNASAESADSLRNESNYVVQAIQHLFNNEESFELCYENDSLSSDNFNFQLSEDVRISSFSMKYNDESDASCLTVQPDSGSLQVHFTMQDENGKTYGSERTYSKAEPLELTVAMAEDEEEEEPQEPDDPTTEKPADCIYLGDTKLVDWQFGDWNYCPVIHVQDGSLWIPQSNSVFIHFIVDHYFYVYGSLSGQQAAIFEISKDAVIQDSVTLHSNNKFSARNMSAGSSLTLETNSTIHLKGALSTGNTTIFKSNTEVSTESYLNLGGNTTVQENAKVTSGGDLTIAGNLLLTGNPTVNIAENILINGDYTSENEAYVENGSDFTLAGNLQLKGSSVIYTKGNILINGNAHIQDNAKLISDGNITIKGSITPDWGGGTICAAGEVKMENPYTGNEMEIIENSQACSE